MKTPTLEEVKEHFKNAKQVKCLSSDRIYDLTKIKIIKDIHEWHDGYWIDAEVSVNNIKIVDECSNFAEIISYKTPTLEEIIKHFKNAKEVKSSFSKVIFEYKGLVSESQGEYFEANQYYLYHNVRGYSKIISYKDSVKQTVKELLKGSEFENLDWIFYTEDYGESRRGLVVDVRKIKLTQEQAEDIIGYKFEII